jgi:cytochrome bd-type quinol oxidase subunit 2
MATGIVAVASVFLLAGVPQVAQAAACTGTAAECARAGLTTTGNVAGLDTDQTRQSLPVIIGNLIYSGLSLTGIIFVILMVYAGILYMQARGKTEDMEKAKKIIEAAIIGIVITGLAFAITNFVINRIVETQGASSNDAPRAIENNGAGSTGMEYISDPRVG